MITKYPSVIIYLMLLLYTNLINIDYQFSEFLIFFLVCLYLIIRLFINKLYFVIIASFFAITICELNRKEKIHLNLDESVIIKKEEFLKYGYFSGNLKNISINHELIKCAAKFRFYNGKSFTDNRHIILNKNISLRKKGFYIVKGVKYLIKGDKENLEVYSGLKFENLKSSFSHDVLLNKLNLTDYIEVFLSAIIFGDKTKLSDEQEVAFKNSGTMHIFAVSGLHMGCLFIAIMTILKVFSRYINGSVIVSLALLFGYLYLVDFSISATRAYVMLLLWSVAKIIGLKSNNLNIVCLAGIFLLVTNPHNSQNLSYLLSFSVVLTIVYVFSAVKKLTTRGFKAYIFHLSLLNFSAFCGSFIILLVFFKKIIFISFLSNFFLIPILSFLLPLSLIILLIAFFDFSIPFVNIFDSLIGFIFDFCLFMSSFPFGSISLNNIESNFFYINLYNILLILFSFHFKNILKRVIFLIFIIFLFSLYILFIT